MSCTEPYVNVICRILQASGSWTSIESEWYEIRGTAPSRSEDFNAGPSLVAWLPSHPSYISTMGTSASKENGNGILPEQVENYLRSLSDAEQNLVVLDIRVHDLAIVTKNSNVCAKILHFAIFFLSFLKKLFHFSWQISMSFPSRIFC